MDKTKALLFGGALAAALSLPTTAMAGPVKLTATLSGANETGGGATSGSGSFSVDVDDEAGDFCYQLKFSGVGSATAAHIHAGAAGADGDVVVTLDAAGGDVDECIAVEPDKLKPIVASPADFYVNIHTAAFPKGALRGQLAKSK